MPNDVIKKLLLDEAARRFGIEALSGEATGQVAAAFAVSEAIITRIRSDLFAEQNAFILDSEKRKALLCSRRAGKTRTLVSYLILTSLLYPSSKSVFISLTRASAKRIVWPTFLELNDRYHLGLEFNISELSIRFRNGSIIFITGANTESEIAKLRGSHYRLVVIDEAQDFREHIDALIRDVIEPALGDTRGTLCLAGTPRVFCYGVFFDITTGKRPNWSTHKWTVISNIFFHDPAAWLAETREAQGWSEETPAFRCEYLGEWVKAEDELVYHYDALLNSVEALPASAGGLPIEWSYILGIDVGFEDDTAFNIGAFTENLPNFYLIKTEKHKHLIPSVIAKIILELQEAWEPVRIVMDCGALGKGYAEEFRQRHSIPIIAAEKRDKAAFIELMNGDLRTGKVKLVEADCLPLITEWDALQWDAGRRGENPRQPNHCADAALYAWRDSRHYTHKAIPDGPVKGSTEYWQAFDHSQELAEVELLRNSRDREWWSRGTDTIDD